MRNDKNATRKLAEEFSYYTKQSGDTLQPTWARERNQRAAAKVSEELWAGQIDRPNLG